MISNTKTLAVSAIAIAAVIALFAATPFVVAQQAQAFGWGGGGWGHHRFFGGGFNRFSGGFFSSGWGGGCGGCCGGCGSGRRLGRLVKQSPPLFLFFKTRERKFT